MAAGLSLQDGCQWLRCSADMAYKLLYGIDVLEGLKQLESESVQCVVTSPPYWGLRDYGVENQLGLEPTPEVYVEKLVSVFREVGRALRDGGTVFLNLGDSYNSPPVGKFNGGGFKDSSAITGGRDMSGIASGSIIDRTKLSGLKPKDRCGIPHRVVFALQKEGWWWRDEIIWHKPNPMPESVTDRCTKSHEFVFMLTKSANYYYDQAAIKEPMSEETKERDKYGFNGAFKGQFRGTPNEDRWQEGRPFEKGSFYSEYGRNPRSVWSISTQGYAGAHFAVMPIELAKKCILAGSKAGDTVLDMFSGSATTIQAAVELGRIGIGIDLNSDYLPLAEKRLAQGVLI